MRVRKTSTQRRRVERQAAQRMTKRPSLSSGLNNKADIERDISDHLISEFSAPLRPLRASAYLTLFEVAA